METKTTMEIIEENTAFASPMTYRCIDNPTDRWVKVDDEIKEALSLYFHLKNHKEVQLSKINTGIPMCTICGKTSIELTSLKNIDELEKS
jgi:hypothetical protein